MSRIGVSFGTSKTSRNYSFVIVILYVVTIIDLFFFLTHNKGCCHFAKGIMLQKRKRLQKKSKLQ